MVREGKKDIRSVKTGYFYFVIISIDLISSVKNTSKPQDIDA